MGFPFIGEMISLLWYFKIVRRPDDFINAKRRKYGDGEGMFRTHLFGKPSIIVYAPAIHKFVLFSDSNFKQDWPTVEVMGRTSMVAVHGKAHTRVRNFVINAINRPDALTRIAALVQPNIVVSLRSWAEIGKIKAKFETQKLILENIGKLFLGKESGPFINSLHKLYQALLLGVRAYPINIPGFAYHHALQCRRKLEDIFWMELSNRKSENKGETIDLMDGLIQIEDGEEVIRVAKVSAFLLRKVVNEVDYKGYKIPKVWNVILFLRYLHTNPEKFNDPMYFNLDRWNVCIVTLP
ncbi:ent-kaurenoic acid monooxygenase [Trifolium repens]|nr:ent-kaurenoic acid monooxygenase [Trifolium repens]